VSRSAENENAKVQAENRFGQEIYSLASIDTHIKAVGNADTDVTLIT
jgi:hypothetical protein